MQKLTLATFLSSNLEPSLRKLGEYLAAELDVQVDFRNDLGFSELLDCSACLALMCGFAYTEIERLNPDALAPLAAPLTSDERVGDKPVYYSELIVPADSRNSTLQELSGASFAFNEERSFSGYMLIKDVLQQKGHSIDFFGSTTKSGSHAASLREVAQARAQAATLDSHFLQLELKEHPDLEHRIRKIVSYGPYPMPPVVANSSIPDDKRHHITALLLEAHKDEQIRSALNIADIERFESVSSSDYDPIREIAERVRDPGADRDGWRCPS